MASIVVAGALALPLTTGHADSTECGKHMLLPVAQEGFSAANEGDVQGGSGALYVCNNGSTVPAPARGHLEIGGDANAQKGYVYIDGDSANAPVSDCADGYFRIDLSTGAPVFYNEASGKWASTHEKKDAAGFAQAAAEDCAP